MGGPYKFLSELGVSVPPRRGPFFSAKTAASKSDSLQILDSKNFLKNLLTHNILRLEYKSERDIVLCREFQRVTLKRSTR
jgi:hypothetical protein